MEGFVGRKTGRRRWRGKQIVCIKYAISSRLSIGLNWVQTKIFERRAPNGGEYPPNMESDQGIT